MDVKGEFVERQFARAMTRASDSADGESRGAHDVRAVAADLRSTLGAAFAPAIDAHETKLLGAGDRKSMTARVLDRVRAAGGDVSAAYVAFDARLQLERQALRGFFATAAELGAYLGALLGVLLVVVIVYAGWVLPQFRGLYRSLEQPLPRLTAALLGDGPVVVLVLLAILVAIGVVAWGFARARRRMLRLEASPRAWERAPVFGRALAAHRVALGYGLQEVFLAAGVAPSVARVEAEQLTGAALPERADEAAVLEAAARVGALREELRVQAEQRRAEALAALMRARRIAFHVARLLVYAVIGLFVIAMYLPIFNLGSALD
jgi:hypothetical protein